MICAFCSASPGLPTSLVMSLATRTNEPAEPLMAVLAFDNLSTDADMTWFSDGVSPPGPGWTRCREAMVSARYASGSIAADLNRMSRPHSKGRFRNSRRDSSRRGQAAPGIGTFLGWW